MRVRNPQKHRTAPNEAQSSAAKGKHGKFPRTFSRRRRICRSVCDIRAFPRGKDRRPPCSRVFRLPRRRSFVRRRLSLGESLMDRFARFRRHPCSDYLAIRAMPHRITGSSLWHDIRQCFAAGVFRRRSLRLRASALGFGCDGARGRRKRSIRRDHPEHRASHNFRSCVLRPV